MKINTLSCVIVDNEQGYLDTLSHHIAEIPYLTLKATFDKPIDALTYLLKNPTDLLITEINMPQLSGIELIESISFHASTKVIFVSSYVDKIVEALQYNAVDYIQKPINQKRFNDAIQKVVMTLNFEQKSYDSIPSEVLVTALLNYPLLGKIEKQVMVLIFENYCTQEIADLLFVTRKTIENHRGNIRKKLKVQPENSLTAVANFLAERIK